MAPPTTPASAPGVESRREEDAVDKKNRWIVQGALCALVAFTIAFESLEVLAGNFDETFAPSRIIGAMVAMGVAQCGVTTVVTWLSPGGVARVMLSHVLTFIAVLIGAVALYAWLK